MSLSVGVPHGDPVLSALIHAESLKLVWVQPAGGSCAAFHEVSMGIFDMLPEADFATNRPITLAGWASLLVAASASVLVPGCNSEVTLMRAVASQRAAEFVADCPLTNTPQTLSAYSANIALVIVWPDGRTICFRSED